MWGTWAAVFSVFHLIVTWMAHSNGGGLIAGFLHFFVAPDGSLLTNSFGLGNWTGLVALVIVVGLLAISNDAALQKLQAGPWKRLQRMNYALFALVIAHAFFYGALLRVKSPLRSCSASALSRFSSDRPSGSRCGGGPTFAKQPWYRERHRVGRYWVTRFNSWQWGRVRVGHLETRKWPLRFPARLTENHEQRRLKVPSDFKPGDQYVKAAFALHLLRIRSILWLDLQYRHDQGGWKSSGTPTSSGTAGHPKPPPAPGRMRSPPEPVRGQGAGASANTQTGTKVPERLRGLVRQMKNATEPRGTGTGWIVCCPQDESSCDHHSPDSRSVRIRSGAAAAARSAERAVCVRPATPRSFSRRSI